MTRVTWCVLTLVALAGCSPSAPATRAKATPSARATTSAAPASPGGPTAAPGAPATGGQSTDCAGQPGAGHALALVMMRGAGDMVVRDVTDIDHPATVRTLSGFPNVARFRSATQVSYTTYAGPGPISPGSIYNVDLTSGTTTELVHWNSGGFMAGIHAWSPDGSSLTYLLSDPAGVRWHLRSGQNDRTLATLAPVPGRGIGNDFDDAMLAFSPDGKYVALEQTFTGESGQTAGLQVRATDGSLILSLPETGPALDITARPTMAVWDCPSTLYYREDSGVYRWSPGGSPALVLPGHRWVRPQASLSTHLIAFGDTQPSHLPLLQVYNTANGALAAVGQAALGEAHFLGTAGVWAAEYVTCAACIGPSTQSGRTFIYELGPGILSPSAISYVFDSYPR